SDISKREVLVVTHQNFLNAAKSFGVNEHDRWNTRLAENLAREIGPDRGVFLCCQKDVEALAKSFRSDDLRLDVGHWGAVDGRNDWQHCTVAVIYGLPYMDKRRAINRAWQSW